MSKVTKQGTIIRKSDKRTAVVETFLMKSHPLYKKRFKVVKKYIADDKKDAFKVGDIVIIKECKPISKRKHFEVVSKVGSKIVGNIKIEGEEVLGSVKEIKENEEDKNF